MQINFKYELGDLVEYVRERATEHHDAVLDYGIVSRQFYQRWSTGEELAYEIAFVGQVLESNIKRKLKKESI